MINWQVIGQLLTLGVVILVGPIVIILLSLRQGNL